MDIAGNVWERVANWYSVDNYAISQYENLTGPTSGEFHVTRGGSWFKSRAWEHTNNKRS
ncbi:MAG: SUMF1/EgtB/PvdO family nonheme iron enzyme [Anaerolineaceae bacterium]|nr:SUMF1/EgtB/PvdO family nonheme iron enzyme [Anaerolineaceae bacterium]